MINRFFSALLDKNDKRSAGILKQIFYSAGLKAVNAAVSFLIIPLYLSYLTEISFGIWLTVSSVLNWFNFFDLGMGNGLRNKFAEATAEGKHQLAASFVSTTYGLMSMISLGLLLLFLVANVFVDWSQVFSAPQNLSQEVNTMVVVLLVFFCPQFTLQLIKMIVTADQRPALASLMNSIVNVLHLIGIFLLIQFSEPSLVNLALVMGGVNLAIPLLANISLFSARYKDYIPRMSKVNLDHSKSLLGIGFTFFILQGAALVVFMTDNFIITKVLGPEEVPAYNISYRYFNLLAVFFGLVTTPFWSAFTEAFVKRDVEWIKKSMRRLLLVWGIIVLAGFVMYLVAPKIYTFWIKDKVNIPQLLNLFMLIWVLLSAFLSIYGTLLSGVGKLRLSLYHAGFVMVVNIPLSIWLASFDSLGSAGVILATILGLSLRLFFQPLQVYLIVSEKAKGAWNR